MENQANNLDHIFINGQVINLTVALVDAASLFEFIQMVRNRNAERPKSRLQKTTMLVLAVTLHKIPEGMAVGVVYAGYLAGDARFSPMSALALSLGIAIQNFPEGAIISMPLREEGMGKSQAFLWEARRPMSLFVKKLSFSTN